MGGGPMGGGASLTEAGAALRSAARDRVLLRRVVALFGPYRRPVTGVGVLILLASGLGVASPLLIKVVFDRGLFARGGPNVALLLVVCSVMVLITIGTSALGVWQAYLTNRIGQDVMRDLRGRLFSHLQQLSLRFFTGTRTGEIQSRLQNDVGGLQTVITDTASSILGNLVTLVSTLVAMAVLSWQLTLLSVALLPVFIWLTGRVGKIRRTLTGETQGALSEMSAITQESLSVSGVLLAKVFGRQDRDSERYAAANTQLARLQVRQQIVGRAFFAVVSSFFSLMPVAVYVIAGLELSGGHGPSAGTLVAITTLQTRLFMPLGQLLQTSTEISSSLALFTRVFAYLDLEAEIVEPAAPVSLEQVRGEVRLDDVRFSYETEPESGAERPRRWALQGLDLHVQPGQLAAVVGASGAGKTTISYLIPRLYDASSGVVSLDGHDVRELSLATLSEAIGMVTQETYLFHATVRDNLAYARPDASLAEVEAAARAAQVHERILELENGYDTVVGERGYRLSGGEKQRMAIARVLLKNPAVLVLDEATSALDTVNERLVQAALEPLMRGRTTIAIAHRLSTIRAADVIFVVDAGRVVERGSHAELLALGGRYAALYDQQYGGGLVEARCADGLRLADGRVLETTTTDAPSAAA
ncbi:MAG: ABC transporter ATP-binding protein/permease [Actinomycetota bacterium]|nr:ABC transporter ATP-binding protein/permease [Actinomycetota bacterium]